ncbi:hypothetical protein LWF01_04025 [Saxibacter everestensis]|uniref:Uncharacterized protein n=1 Tax=Saxibacter everestensis TaxID=2909229 RepID=A0ABY8QVI2_9MICO|nr:hypothetical protein LWF01_04025 [Brevibacteriaceae bacterium ZFBP1038]
MAVQVSRLAPLLPGTPAAGTRVGGLHLVPTVVADAVGLLAGEIACAIAIGGVDESDRDATSCEATLTSKTHLFAASD